MPEARIAIVNDERTRWRAELIEMIASHEARLKRTKSLWNKLYYSSIYGVVIASALSVLVLKLESWKGAWQIDAAALLATFSAVLGAVSAAGNFQRRWGTARLARAEMQKLLIDLQNPVADLERIAGDCKRAIDAYQEGAIGSDA